MRAVLERAKELAARHSLPEALALACVGNGGHQMFAQCRERIGDVPDTVTGLAAQRLIENALEGL
jgi:hypothetical protein